MKILFTLPNLNGGGAERVIVNILNSLDEKKFEKHLFLAQNSGIYFKTLSSSVKLHVHDFKRTLLSFFALRKSIKEIEPKIIFSTTHRMNLLVVLATLTLRKKYITLLRLPNSPKLEIENKQLSSLEIFLYKYTYNKATYVVAQTPEMAEEITTYFHVKKESIKLFLNPIDKKLIDKSIQNIENPFNKNFINIVAAGRITHQKGFDILIKSLHYIVEKNPNFRLYIIGKESTHEYMSKLNQLIKSLNLKNHIFFLGFQENPYRYFFYSDLYVLSSRWEGLPNTVLENLYLKKPIISTRCIPFMETLIEDKKTGLLVDIEQPKALANAILDYKCIKAEKSIINDNVDVFFETILQESSYETK